MTACTTTVNTDTTRSATLTSVFPSPSDASTPATPIGSHKSSQKPKLRPRLNPRELNRKISTLLSSALFHRRPDRDPVPPSLAYSRLPPPCAELDPSPKYRIRRFKKWRDQVPELRMALLDPKRRGHLVRYQTYAVPCTSSQQRGVKRKIFPRGCEIRDYAAWPTVESIRTHWSRTTAPRQGKPVSAASVASAPHRKTIPVRPVPNGAQRRQDRIRLEQHRWILHAENERRWRQGMREVMTSVVWFQDRCMLEPSKWKDGKGVWLPDYDLDEVTHLTELFRDIRRNPSKVFELSPTIEPVKGRREAEMAVKANESDRSRRKEERRQKRAELTSSTDLNGIAKPTPTSVTSSTQSAPKTDALPISQRRSKTVQGPGEPKARSGKPRERSDGTRASRREAEGMRAGRVSKENSVTLPRNSSDPHSIAPLDQPVTTLVSHTPLKRSSRQPRLGADPQIDTPALPTALSSSTPRSKPSRSSDALPTGSRRSHTTSATNHSPVVISEANQASLFRLLLQMSQTGTTSDRVVRTETAAQIHLPERHTQPRQTPKPSDTDGSPRLMYLPSVSGGKSRTANRTDRPHSPITPSTHAITSVPSLASSSSTIQITVKPRPYSLIIDDDTMDVDADTLITPLSSISLSVNQAQTYQAWSTGGKDGDNADMVKIKRYLRVLGLYDESDISDDALEIHLSSSTDGGDTARSGSTFDTLRSY